MLRHGRWRAGAFQPVTCYPLAALDERQSFLAVIPTRQTRLFVSVAERGNDIDCPWVSQQSTSFEGLAFLLNLHEESPFHCRAGPYHWSERVATLKGSRGKAHRTI